MMVHTWNPSIQQAQSEDCYEFEVSLLNIVHSRPAQATV